MLYTPFDALSLLLSDYPLAIRESLLSLHCGYMVFQRADVIVFLFDNGEQVLDLILIVLAMIRLELLLLELTHLVLDQFLFEDVNYWLVWAMSFNEL